MHTNFIFGFDDANKLFYTLGYGYNRQYGIIEAPFSSVIDAYMGCEDQIVEIYKTDMNKHYVFDQSILCQQLFDYLESRNTIESDYDLSSNGLDKSTFLYGLNTYDRLIKHIKGLLTGSYSYDVRNLFVLYEHKKLMQSRIRYLIVQHNLHSLEVIANDALSLCREAEHCKNMMLKWMIAHDERHISVVLRSLDWMKEKETSLLHEVLHALS